MGVTSGLHILVSTIAWFSRSLAFPWLSVATAIWAIAILSSIIFLVPLNNQVKEWNLDRIPENWEQVRKRWDSYHWIRTIGLILAFVLMPFNWLAETQKWRPFLTRYEPISRWSLGDRRVNQPGRRHDKQCTIRKTKQPGDRPES